eukprot:TRINITY_DN3676_c0_g3_i1.p1 TRINITY_DN3676_c0_g3~~TRINITY_DN3676_c0_g3_i1.p1  ORF type:complete len:375 (+),score=83.05 TRINITY_DN3676_c0_g3_i1:77-1201(+)
MHIAKQNLTGHTDTVLCLHRNHGSSCLFSGSEDRTVRVWDLRVGKSVKLFTPFESGVNSIRVSPVDEKMVYVSSGRKVFGFDLRDPKVIMKDSKVVYECNKDEINQIDIDPTGNYLATCDDACEVKIINISPDSSSPVKTFRKHDNIISTIAFLPQGEPEVFSGGMDSRIVQWKYKSGTHVHAYLPPQETDQGPQVLNPPFIHHLELSPDGRHLAAAVGNGDVVLFNLPFRRCSHVFHAHTCSVSQVSFAKFSRKHLISGGNDCQIILYSLNLDDPILSPSNQPTATGSKRGGRGKTRGSRKPQSQPLPPPPPPPPPPQDLDSTMEVLSEGSSQILKINQNSKINWIESSESSVFGNIFVADQTEIITAYTLTL